MLPFIIKGISMEHSNHPTEKMVQKVITHETSTWNQPIPFSEKEEKVVEFLENNFSELKMA
jgi:hypothetical protein